MNTGNSRYIVKNRYTLAEAKSLFPLWSLEIETTQEGLPFGEVDCILAPEAEISRDGYLALGTINGGPVRIFAEDGPWSAGLQLAFGDGADVTSDPEAAALAAEAELMPAFEAIEALAKGPLRLTSLRPVGPNIASDMLIRFHLEFDEGSSVVMAVSIDDDEIRDQVLSAIRRRSRAPKVRSKALQTCPMTASVVCDLFQITRGDYDALSVGDGIMLDGGIPDREGFRLVVGGVDIALLSREENDSYRVEKLQVAKEPKSDGTKRRERPKRRRPRGK